MMNGRFDRPCGGCRILRACGACHSACSSPGRTVAMRPTILPKITAPDEKTKRALWFSVKCLANDRDKKKARCCTGPFRQDSGRISGGAGRSTAPAPARRERGRRARAGGLRRWFLPARKSRMSLVDRRLDHRRLDGTAFGGEIHLDHVSCGWRACFVTIPGRDGGLGHWRCLSDVETLTVCNTRSSHAKLQSGHAFLHGRCVNPISQSERRRF